MKVGALANQKGGGGASEPEPASSPPPCAGRGGRSSVSTLAPAASRDVPRGPGDRIKAKVNKRLRISGVFATFYNARESQSLEVVEKLREKFGNLVYETLIRRNTDTAKAAGWAEAIVTADPRTLGGQDYLALTEEFLRRQKA